MHHHRCQPTAQNIWTPPGTTTAHGRLPSPLGKESFPHRILCTGLKNIYWPKKWACLVNEVKPCSIKCNPGVLHMHYRAINTKRGLGVHDMHQDNSSRAGPTSFTGTVPPTNTPTFPPSPHQHLGMGGVCKERGSSKNTPIS